MGPSLSHRSQASALPPPPAHLRPANPVCPGDSSPCRLPPSFPELLRDCEVCVGGVDGGFRDSCTICEMRGENQPRRYHEPCQGREEKGLGEDEVCTERSRFLPTQCISGLIPCEKLCDGLGRGLWVRGVLTPTEEHFHASVLS